MNSKSTCGRLKLILGALLIVVCSCNNSKSDTSPSESGSFTDPRDGKVYKTVKIGNQWIMAENLAYKPDQGKYWTYNNDSNNVAVYGYLYDWETAKNIAPQGWHLPSREEWKLFRKVLGGKGFTINANSRNFSSVYEKVIPGGSSGFNALFGGGCYQDGKLYEHLNEIGSYWSSTGSVDGPYIFFVARPDSFMGNKEGIGAIKSHENSSGGKSVRLFKD